MKVLKNARLIDGTGAGAGRGATIVIEGQPHRGGHEPQPERLPGRGRDDRLSPA